MPLNDSEIVMYMHCEYSRCYAWPVHVRQSLGHRFLLQLAEVMIEPRRAVRRAGQSRVQVLASVG